MLKNKKFVFIIIALLLILITGLYATYALGVTSTNDSINSYDLTLTGDNNTITLAANESKIVLYKVKNTNNGRVKYGVGYTNSVNVNVVALYDTIDEPTGMIEQSNYKYVKLRVTNNTNSELTTSISTILGYENGGDLIVPSGVTLVDISSDVSSTSFLSSLYSKTGVLSNWNYDIDATHSIIKDQAGNLRYYGANPNNYIYFNCSDYSNPTSSTCETWRIIGKVDGKLKLLRNSSIGEYSWDSSPSNRNSGKGVNEWSQSAIKSLLNPGFSGASASNSLYYNLADGICYNGQNSATTQCNFATNSTGIRNYDTRNMIADAVYYLGGANNSANGTIEETYNYERGTATVSNPTDNMERTTRWTGKIALPYPSDYLYAADLSLCNDNLGDYGNFTSVNWMYNILTNNGTNHGWLITPSSNYSSSAWYVLQAGDLSHDGMAANPRNIVPTLYLNSNVNIDISHDGDSSDPYTLVQS